MDMLETIRGAAVNTQRIIEGIRPDQMGNATPCTDLDVRGVLEHMLGGGAMLGAIFTGTPGAPLELGDQPASAVKQMSEQLLVALEAPGLMEKEFDFGGTAMPGARLAGIVLMEMVVHGWDLAKATDQDHGIPDPLAEGMLAQAQHLPDSYRGETGAPFRPAMPIADDAPAADRLAAFLGREV
jgi:uncharacterized protein (TIGR03086 family)